MDAPLQRALEEVVDDFRRGWPSARVWMAEPDGWVERTDEGSLPGEPPCDALEVPGGGVRVLASGEAACGAAHFLGQMLERVRRHGDEIRSFSREMAERYEEINLLYSISEILGSIISLEDAARTILGEVASILNAARAALWVTDAGSDFLNLAAVEGGGEHHGPIRVDDPHSITAEVYRTQRAVILAPEQEWPRRDDHEPRASERGAFLSVPVSYTPPEGEARTIGVINLIGRASDGGFSASDLKLLAAIASQVGAAVANNRLVEETLRREGMVREMQLAHDLQLKLLPAVEQFARYAEVAARCVPAESVGGDFYHLFRLPGGRLGVLIGDVSSHGFGAALIMALTMGSVAIHASEGDDPADVLRRTHQAVIDELETTEMYLTLFYGVIDPALGTLTYSNAGHSHAFLVPADGSPPRRLGATGLPLGMADQDDYGEATVEWKSEGDLLFLFTDGLSDSLGLGEVEGERVLLHVLAERREQPCEALMARLFSHPAQGREIPPDDRSAVLVRM